MRSQFLLRAALLTSFTSSIAEASVIYVRASATGAGNGTSWTDAYIRLQDAIGAAQAGDQLWVAAGTYRPTVANGAQTLSFNLRTGVAIFGGFAGSETQFEQRNFVTNLTVLNGDLNNNDPGSTSDNSYHVVRATNVDASAVLDGVIVERGNSSRSGAPVAERHGAGLLIVGGGPTIRNCTIRDNVTWPGPQGFYWTAEEGGDGAGVHATDAILVFENCTFLNNLAGSGDLGATFSDPDDGGSGGAIYAVNSTLRCTNCNFSGNRTGNGGFASEAAGANGGSGGAIWLAGPSLELVNCSFNDNRTGNGAGSGFDSGPPGLGGYGGAIGLSGGQLTITGGTFSANRTGSGLGGHGGAIYVDSGPGASISSVQFSGNICGAGSVSRGSGGAIYSTNNSLQITGSNFMNNAAGNYITGASGTAIAGSGGAILHSGLAMTIEDCDFSGNLAGDANAELGFAGSGGAIQCGGATIRSSGFVGNMAGRGIGASGADGAGGAIYGSSLSITNSVFVNNRTEGTWGTGHGGAIRCSALTMTNTSVVQNTASADGGGASVTGVIDADSCIFWNNVDAGGSGEGAQIGIFGSGDSIDYSCVQGLSGSFGGVGNIGSDPLFLNAASDFRLRPNSPCIDAGNNAAVPAEILLDINGDPRFLDDPDTFDTGVGSPPVVDMGATEFDPCVGDVNGDNRVNLSDLALLLAQFGTTGTGLAADFDNDGVVDLSDLSALLSHFGEACA